jgi:antitoxin (DNA-binding transcriptional repressor) of toxin-antitoxin stability system
LGEEIVVVRTVNMHEAKTHLSRLVDEEFIIARDGRPVARVVPIRDETPAPRIGFLPEITVPDDFDEMGTETIAAMFGAP